LGNGCGGVHHRSWDQPWPGNGDSGTPRGAAGVALPLRFFDTYRTMPTSLSVRENEVNPGQHRDKRPAQPIDSHWSNPPIARRCEIRWTCEGQTKKPPGLAPVANAHARGRSIRRGTAMPRQAAKSHGRGSARGRQTCYPMGS
jgi:hypothetical protein